MKILKLIAVMMMLAPAPGLAKGLLSASEMNYLIKTCFATFYHAAGQPFQVDRGRFAKMGFTAIKDTPSDFEAQRVISQQFRSFKNESFGPMIDVRRHKRRPNKLLFKSCVISGGDDNYTRAITNVSSRKVQGMLETEAKRLGFRPYRNAKNKIVWIKGEVAVYLTQTYNLKAGQSANGSPSPVFVYVDGVHPRDLRGIN